MPARDRKIVCGVVITSRIGCDHDCDYKILLLGYTLITVVITQLITLARGVISVLTADVIRDDRDRDYKIFLLGHIFITGVINLITPARDEIMAKE